jgi:hypothetical protein
VCISIVQRFQTDGGEGMTKNNKISFTITGGGLPPFRGGLDSESKTTRTALDEEIKQIMNNFEKWEKEDKKRERGTAEVEA